MVPCRLTRGARCWGRSGAECVIGGWLSAGTHVGPQRRLVVQFGASFASHIHRPFRKADKSDSDVHGHRYAARKSDASNHVPEVFSRSSLPHRRIPALPEVEPTVEKGLSSAIQQILKA